MKLEEQILNTLEKQKFADWYNQSGAFDRYISGELPTPTREEILADIRRLFNLKEECPR